MEEQECTPLCASLRKEQIKVDLKANKPSQSKNLISLAISLQAYSCHEITWTLSYTTLFLNASIIRRLSEINYGLRALGLFSFFAFFFLLHWRHTPAFYHYRANCILQNPLFSSQGNTKRARTGEVSENFWTYHQTLKFTSSVCNGMNQLKLFSCVFLYFWILYRVQS